MGIAGSTFMCHGYWKGATRRFLLRPPFLPKSWMPPMHLGHDQIGITWNQCWVSATSTGWLILNTCVYIYIQICIRWYTHIYKYYMYPKIWHRYQIWWSGNVSPFKSGYVSVSMLNFGSYICLFQSYLLRTFLHPKENCIDSCRQCTHIVCFFVCLGLD